MGWCRGWIGEGFWRCGGDWVFCNHGFGNVLLVVLLVVDSCCGALVGRAWLLVQSWVMGMMCWCGLNFGVLGFFRFSRCSIIVW